MSAKTVSSLWRCLRYDMVAGRRFMAVTCLGTSIITVSLFIYLYALAPSYGIDTSSFSFGDALAIILAGSPHIEIRPGVIPSLPLGWLVLIDAVLSASVSYPASDLRRGGGASILLGGSRKTWMASKMAWSAMTVFLACAVMGVVALAISIALGFSLDLSLHEEAFRLTGVWMDYLTFVPESILLFAAQAILVTLAFVEVQLVVGLFVHPLFAFGLITAYAVAGCYIEVPAFIGNGLMFARWGLCIANGVPPEPIIVLAFAALALACLSAFLLICRIDLLERRV